MKVPFDIEHEYVLEDDCVLLRPLKQSDCKNLLYYSLNEPDLWQYSLQKAAGEENLKSYIETALEAKKNKKEYPFLVFDKRKSQYAGSTRFYDMQLSYSTLQLGYTWYGKDFQGSGLNGHCKFLLLQFAFETMGMERVEFRADNRNLRSIAAMKKIGCVPEGVLRNHMPDASGGRRDSIVLSIIRNDWFGHTREQLYNQLK